MVSAMMVLDLGIEEGLAPRLLHHLVSVLAELARMHLGELLEGGLDYVLEGLEEGFWKMLEETANLMTRSVMMLLES